MWHLSGWAFIVLQTRLQATTGGKSLQAARRRVVGMPTQVAASLVGHPPPCAWRSVIEWLVGQVRMLLVDPATPAVVYCLSGPAAVYVGYSGRRPRSSCPTFGPAVHRHWERVRDLERGRLRNGLHKVQQLARAPLTHLVQYSISVGDVPHMRTLERAVIRMVAPTANSALATRSGWHRGAEAQRDGHRRPRRRPRPRLCGSGPPAALEAALTNLALATARTHAHDALSASRAPYRALRECNFSEAYIAYRRTAAPGVAGPTDVAAPEAYDLLVSCLCSHGGVVTWRRLYRR